MTYQTGPGFGHPMTDDARRQLTELESINSPTPWAKGVLDSLRMRATTDADQTRCAQLAAKWETK